HRRIQQQRWRPVLQREYFSSAVVTEQICADRDRGSCAAVDITSDDGTAPGGVIVLCDRRNIVGWIARCGAEVSAGAAFENPPPVVPAYHDDVDLLEPVLSHVTDVQLPRLPIE